MKENIIIFSGENLIFLQKELDKWIKVFLQKYSEHNLIKITKQNFETINISQELISPPFFAPKKLIIIEDIFSKDEKSEENNSKPQNNYDIQIANILDSVPDENIIVFINPSLNKKSILSEKLSVIGKIKEFENLSGEKLKLYIRERLLGIDNDAILELIKYKNSELNKIETELDKLELFKQDGRVSLSDIKTYVSKEIEVSIFDLVDAIFTSNYDLALKKLDEISLSNNIFATLSALISNIRNYIYINILTKNGHSKDEIVKNYKIHSFVVGKAISNKSKFQVISNIFEKLVDLDYRAKIGEIVGDGDDAVKLALEKIIFDLKKN